MKDLKLAWLNIWRNKRRTTITLASIFFGVLISTLMTSVENGMYSKMIDNVVGFYSGYMQVHHPEYWDTKSIDYVFEPTAEMMEKVSSTPHIDLVVPRLESFALMSFLTNTKGGMVLGIDPKKENELTKLSQWIKAGRYLMPNDDGIIMAINLANNLGVGIGDTVALISSGYHGMSASELFPVVGILEFPTITMNNFGTYISLSKAQEFFSAPKMVSSLALTVTDYTLVPQAKKSLQKKLGKQSSVIAWNEMNPTTEQMIQAGKGKNGIFKGILYLLVGFGVFSTIIMMVADRKKELGVMIAVGMKKTRLAKVLFLETLFIGLIGLASGFALSVPLIFVLSRAPIPITGAAADTYEKMGMEAAIFFSKNWDVFGDQLYVIFFITLVVAIYPFNKILRLKVTDAMKA